MGRAEGTVAAPGKARVAPAAAARLLRLPAHQATACWPAAAGGSSSTPATPFAWLDTANLMEPGSIWVGISAVRWQGAGLSEVSFPVVDAAFGVTPRLQNRSGVLRVRTSGELEGPQGGMGTTFLNGKIGILTDSERPLKVAVTPTFEILSQAAMQWMPIGRNRVQWGLPVSLEIDRGVSRVYGSTGYFFHQACGLPAPVRAHRSVRVSACRPRSAGRGQRRCLPIRR